MPNITKQIIELEAFLRPTVYGFTRWLSHPFTACRRSYYLGYIFGWGGMWHFYVRKGSCGDPRWVATTPSTIRAAALEVVPELIGELFEMRYTAHLAYKASIRRLK